MTRQEQGFKFKIKTSRLTVWGKILYASTYQSALSMANFYGPDSIIEEF